MEYLQTLLDNSEMEYYNGLVFQGYLKALPRPLLKGGRYDLLLQKFTPGAVSYTHLDVYKRQGLHRKKLKIHACSA